MQIGLDSFTHFQLSSRMQLMLNASYSGTNPQYFFVLGVGHQKKLLLSVKRRGVLLNPNKSEKTEVVKKGGGGVSVFASP